ncbi:helix-turn-helix domain-containing protein [Streptomyces sp. NPDC021212]|uniref:helix-turn-helix domain-containing protein n=1 Tax=Streptomyces sp. NPDC021212 TaxID=3365118 RepID=UPI0037B9F55F
MSNQHMGSEVAKLAAQLRDLRARRGNPTYESLGRMAGMSQATISRMLSGRVLPSWDVVALFIRALDREADVGPWRRQYSAALAEREEKREEARLRLELSSPQESSQLLAAATDLSGFQRALRELIRESGLSLREAAVQAGVARSTVSDALNGTRVPSRDVVAALARACGHPSDDWVNAADWLRDAQGKPPARDVSAVSSDTRVLASQVAEAGPADAMYALMAGAATRTPAEIAALALRLREQGHAEAADSLLAAVARVRAVDEVAAVAVALLEAARPVDVGAAEADEAAKAEPARFWRLGRRNSTA